MSTPRLYLASASPRRRAIISMLNMPVDIGVAPVDEPALESQYAGDVMGLCEYLARHKALATARELVGCLHAPYIVLGADTTVILDGRVLGKPRDLIEAADMLRDLRGREHVVATGVALIPLGVDIAQQPADAHPGIYSTRVTTRVSMREYSDDDVAAYIATGDSLDKAGGYAVQHEGFQPVAQVVGCYLGVIGLPVCAVSALLRQVGVSLPPLVAARETRLLSPCAWCESCRAPLPRFPSTQLA